MAMDKNRLLAYFQANYLPREEVLFKLPFSVPIDTFWPELLSRRKANAVMLPLHNAGGAPYWYMLTEKMISASERLCEKALLQEEPVDLLKAPMTSAMTEEMFFTSFVEGAQIELSAAMDFLRSGTEPEDIHEQMIWNNQRAWSAMAKSLMRPLDEAYIRGLALMLTSDMDGQADDYRQMDTHPIAAMADTPYTVPPASVIPDRMQELYAFLRSPDVHPLIKAAAAQAFLLVTRPFPEGNERLSRMVSAAVLLRSGYDFFRDISISSMIARESYRYYKAMKEIIRTENGGDLTYFMEYYLDLLVRAVDDREERDRRMEQERQDQKEAEHAQMLEKERSLAVIPLATAPSSGAEIHPLAEHTEPFFLKPEEVEPEEVIPHESPPAVGRASFMARIQAVMDATKNRRQSAQKMQTLIGFLERGVHRFTAADYKRETGTEGRVPYKACRYFLDKGLVTREEIDGIFWYRLNFTEEATVEADEPIEAQMEPYQAGAPIENETIQPQPFLRSAQKGRFLLIPQAIEAIRGMRQNGNGVFTSLDLRAVTGFNGKQTCNVCKELVTKGWIEIVDTQKPMHYRLTDAALSMHVEEDEADEHEVAAPDCTQLMQRLDELNGEQASDRDRRVSEFLRNRVLANQMTFYRGDWLEAFPSSNNVLTNDIRHAMNLGLVVRSPRLMGSANHYEYQICAIPRAALNTDALTIRQQEYMTEIHDLYGTNPFTAEKLAAHMQVTSSTLSYHLQNLVERRLLELDRKNGRPSIYWLVVTPEEHPECFAIADEENRQEEVAALPAISSRTGYAAAASPLRSAAALSM